MIDFHNFLNAHKACDHGKAIEALNAGKPLPESTLEQLTTLKNFSRSDVEMRIHNTGLMAKIMQSSEPFADGTQAASLEELGYWLEAEMSQINTMLEKNALCEYVLNKHEQVVGARND